MDFLKTSPGESPVIVEGLFRAPVDRVFAAWTDAEKMKAWFGPEPGSMLSADITFEIGGQWRFLMHDNDDGRLILHGEYQDIQPNARLQFSWHFLKEFPDGTSEETEASLVTVTFREEGAATHMHLRHENIATEDGRLGVGRGWTACYTNLTGWLSS